ncbi:MAG: hypothetical protein SVN78_05755, partial [Deferribacterota bacterium]|nr:hypothetical protein [Deferribacterota bacterium]
YSMSEIVKGLKSGNSFAVHGDLINALEFTVKNESDSATMGDDFRLNKNSNLEITIAYKSPEINNNGDKPIVHHIDLIVGDIIEKIQPNSPDYTKDTNETTRIIKRFNSSDFSKTNDGWYKTTYSVRVDKNTYFRLRGTNLAPNTPFETDQEGNPLVDFKQEKLDGADEAWADLWFYSNPIFVYVN